ncbi:hypothetical protein SF12_10725 [Streptomyces sp. MBRL 601]|nr:hypothetical protein SF12_10725 [Streptomyces sp. MBRL 601]
MRGGDEGPAVLVGEGGELGEAVCGGLAEGGGDARVDGGGPQLGDEGGDREGAAGPGGDVLRSTPSSVRKREGWSPSSAGALTAVTTRRSAARVAAT